MILVVGAYDHDIATYAEQELGFGPHSCAVDVLGEAPCVLCAQDLVRQTLDEELVENLAAREVVGLREVGCGVVPVDPQDRAWREAVGRLGCELARRATSVVRIVCGVPQVIKGARP